MHNCKPHSGEVWAADSLIARLNEARQNGTLPTKPREWEQTIDLDEVTQTLPTLKTHIERVDFLNFHYPSLYILIRKQEGVSIQEIMEQFESLHEDPERMTAYIHLWLLPHFDMLRQQNKLKHGKKKV